MLARRSCKYQAGHSAASKCARILIAIKIIRRHTAERAKETKFSNYDVDTFYQRLMVLKFVKYKSTRFVLKIGYYLS